MKKKNDNIKPQLIEDISESSDDAVSNLAYQSLFDEALSMAHTLKMIDAELRMAAQCEGDYDGGYPAEKLLPALCKIMYADFGYWQNKKYK